MSLLFPPSAVAPHICILFIKKTWRVARNGGAFANITRGGTARPARGGTRAPQFVGVSKRNQARQDKRFAVGPMHINFKPRKSKLLPVRPLSRLSHPLSRPSINVVSFSLLLCAALSPIHLRSKTQNKAIRAIRSGSARTDYFPIGGLRA